MTSSWDKLVDTAHIQRDQARHAVGELHLERNTLQDTLASSDQLHLHDMARTRLADVQERIPPAEAHLQMCENGVAMAEKMRADFSLNPPPLGDRPQQETPPEEIGLRETPKTEIFTSMIKEGESPILHSTLGMPDTLSNPTAPPHPTVDPLLAGALLVAVGKDAIDSARAAYQEQHERRALEPVAAQAMGNHQHGQHLGEVQQLQEQNQLQRAAASAQVQELALQGAAKKDFWQQEFKAEVERTRETFNNQDVDRAGLHARTEDQARETSDARFAVAHDLCSAQARREIIDPQVERYAEARGAGAGQQQVYRELLTEMEAPQVNQRTRELEQQHFPELSPPLSMESPGGLGGTVAPTRSGPESSPGPNPTTMPAEPAVPAPDRNNL
jgi:hypothetical protein